MWLPDGSPPLEHLLFSNKSVNQSRQRSFPPSSPASNSRRIGFLRTLLLGALALWCVKTFLFAGESPTSGESRKTKPEPIRDVSAEEFDRLRTNRTSVILDVRSTREYALGHVPGAVNIDCYEKDFVEKLAALDKSPTYLVNCGAGAQSAGACEKMVKLKFRHVYNLQGGYKAWEEAGKPVQKVKPETPREKE